ncbi:hypothetical protein FGO68_gene7030 [Halteria grandinella]|uniref:Uncharacterized protein n=1 Tax=Halteria grandinella TaxID=5974 RepID=A0A8J8NHG9_HALGN|nr:hypothetical protein FGO68_gene7030 [Halteria grandinella]
MKRVYKCTLAVTSLASSLVTRRIHHAHQELSIRLSEDFNCNFLEHNFYYNYSKENFIMRSSENNNEKQ